MRIPNDHYLIIDLEATCSDDGCVPRHEMEIIEIGAVVLCSRTFEIEDEFETLIRPVRHAELTDFCTQLTGITQADVDNAPVFAAAMADFMKWKAMFPDARFCSWGDYDRNQFRQDCAFYSLAYPFAAHTNLKAEFARTFGLSKKLGVPQALRHVGLTFEGNHHRGLDDARNIARIVQRVCVGG